MALRDGLLWAVRQDVCSVMPLRQLTLLALVAGAKSRDDCTIRDLAESMAIPKPSVTRSADMLEELGLVTREPDPSDRRSIFILPTKQGTAVMKQFSKLVGG